jgi:hypothetical protein
LRDDLAGAAADAATVTNNAFMNRMSHFTTDLDQ